MKNYVKNLTSINIFLVVYCIVFFLVYVSVAYYQHINLSSSLFDLGLQEHVIRMTSEGNYFKSGVETENYLGDHFSLIILPILLIYKLLPFTFTLLALQTAGITMALVGIYRISNLHIKNPILKIIPFLILSWFWGISGLLLFDFHVEVFALPLLIWGIYYLELKHIKKALILLFLALISKEDIGLFIGMLGMSEFIRKKSKYGLLLLIGFLYSYLIIFHVMPLIREEDLDTMARYAYLGNSVGEIIKTIFTEPMRLIEQLAQLYKIKYIIKIILPTLGLFLLAPTYVITILPNFTMNILANYPAQSSALYQYDIAISVGIFLSFILGLSKIERCKRFKIRQNNIYLLLIFFLIVNSFFIVKHPLFSKINNFTNRNEDYSIILEAKKIIPEDATVATSNNLGSHFTDYDNLLLFDPDWIDYDKKPDYIIIDTQLCCSEKNRSYLAQLENLNPESLIFNKGSIVIYKPTNE